MLTGKHVGFEGSAIDAEQKAFSAVIKSETAAVHREAERTGFIADLIRARATRQGYVLFLRNLQPVYAALERGLARRRKSMETVAAFTDPALHRLTPLEADLRSLCGQRWTSLAVLPETEAYVHSIEVAAEFSDGTRLAAHAYARYVGDLSGGQILKAVLTRTLGLSPCELGFYDFPDLPDLAETKRSLREALDTIQLDSLAAEIFVDEAIEAFRHNIAVSRAVQQQSPA